MRIVLTTVGDSQSLFRCRMFFCYNETVGGITMNNAWLIVLTVMVALCLCLLIAILIRNIKGSAIKSDNAGLDMALRQQKDDFMREFGVLNGKIEDVVKSVETAFKTSLESTLGSGIKNAVKEIFEEVNKLKDGLTASVNSLQQENLKYLRDAQDSIGRSQSDQFKSLSESVEKKLEAINSKVDQKLEDGFKKTNDTFSQINEHLTVIKTTTEAMDKLNSDVNQLTTVLSGSQSRGRYGEMTLNAILDSVFGETRNLYSLQYTIHLEGGNKTVKPDAVIFLPDPEKLICIDSKFPDIGNLLALTESDPEYKDRLREFEKRLKEHVDKIAGAYVIDGQTSQEAIMFVPSDGVFAFIHAALYEKIVCYAQKKHVVITSPSTLQPILFTIKSLHLNFDRTKNLKEILKELEGLMSEFKDFEQRWSNYNASLRKLVDDKTHDVDVKIKKIDSRYGKLTRLTAVETEEKESPALETVPDDD